jgi:hypothetical protein
MRAQHGPRCVEFRTVVSDHGRAIINVIGRQPSLLEHRPAGLAEIGLLPPQAGGDGPDVGDFTGAETVNVGRAGPFLLRRSRFGSRGA